MSVSGTPPGSPATIAKMLDFCAGQKIAPIRETCPMSRVNDTPDPLRSGKVPCRIVLENDL